MTSRTMHNAQYSINKFIVALCIGIFKDLLEMTKALFVFLLRKDDIHYVKKRKTRRFANAQ